MVEIKPFKGIYYNQDKIEKIEEVVTPPYDIISPGAQERYYQTHPYNIIRIVLGKTYPKDTEVSNCYTRASEYFNDFVDKQVFIQNHKPAFFIYRQEFLVNSKRYRRLGLICRVKIEDYKNKVILPHEATLKKPKEDRFNLIKNVRLNICPVFGLYEDGDHRISQYLRRITSSDPLMNFIDEYEITHTLWKTEISLEIEQIEALFLDRKVLIADGHHRYEVVLQYKKFLQEKIENPPPDIKYTLFCLTGMEDEGLVIFPIHRLVKNISAAVLNSLVRNLSEDFKVERLALGHDLKAAAKELEKNLAAKGQTAPSFAVILKDNPEALVISLKTGRLKGENQLNSLDVSILHNLVFKKVLKLLPENYEDNIKYTKDTLKVLEEVAGGQWAAGFLLNATRIGEIKDIAFAGSLMPQKSTYFFPKLISGLVINKIL